MAVEALHHNLFCSEVEIKFDGYSTSFEGTRCLYDAKSRDALIKEAFEEKIKNKNAPYSELLETNGAAKDHDGSASNSNPTIVSTHADEAPKSRRREGFEVPMIIDGKKIIRVVKKMKIKRLIKDDGMHASLPI